MIYNVYILCWSWCCCYMLTLNEWSEILIQKYEKSLGLGLEIKSLALVLVLKIMEVLVLRCRVLVLIKRSWQQSLIYNTVLMITTTNLRVFSSTGRKIKKNVCSQVSSLLHVQCHKHVLTTKHIIKTRKKCKTIKQIGLPNVDTTKQWDTM